MAVEAVTIGAPPLAGLPERPYAPSWLDRLLDAIEALPGPVASGYLAVGAAAVVLLYFEPWLMGAASPWRPIEKLYWGAMIGAQLAAAAYLRRLAASAFDAFRPALPLPEDELARLRYELTVIPAKPAFVAVVAAVALTAASLVINPAATGTTALTGVLLAGAFGLQSVVSSLLLVVLLQLFRQMRQIRQTLARSAVIDVFRPGPLHAFSKLTSRAGIALLLLTGSTFLVLPASPAAGEKFLFVWLPYLVVPPLIALTAFVLPLYGMHGRLVEEKERLRSEVEQRLLALFGEINRDVDARDMTRLDALNRATGAILQQREILAKLPTWPWSAGSVRAVGTAILLPLGLFLLQRFLLNQILFPGAGPA